jgi:single-stranded DNA-binding protein
MNNFVLMAEIFGNPQKRYAQDGTEIAEMLVYVPGAKDDIPPHPLKVTAWKELARTVCESYKEGDRVVLEGRLAMNTIERTEGFKEKRAELTIQKIHLIERKYR